MNTTQIKRLYQTNKEFVPITLAEAVVVNTTNITGLSSLGITTLDKVLSSTLGVVNTTVNGINTLNQTVKQINQTLANKQDKLKPGTGITITEDGTISAQVGNNLLYKIVDVLPRPSKECENYIYLVPSPKGVSGNGLIEHICVYNKLTRQYTWEQLGAIQTDVDLSGYVTNETFQQTISPIQADIQSIKTKLDSTITAQNVTTSTGDNVIVDYIIPKTLYDSI